MRHDHRFHLLMPKSLLANQGPQGTISSYFAAWIHSSIGLVRWASLDALLVSKSCILVCHADRAAHTFFAPALCFQQDFPFLTCLSAVKAGNSSFDKFPLQLYLAHAGCEHPLSVCLLDVFT